MNNQLPEENPVNSWLLLISIIFTVLFTITCKQLYDVEMKLKESPPLTEVDLPFDPRLCKNTGKFHTYYVIKHKDDEENYVLKPILDCTGIYDFEEELDGRS